MESYKICACNTCDLPDSYIAANHLGIVSLSYKFGEDSYRRGEQELPEPVFYGKLRAGQSADTEPVSLELADLFFKEMLKETSCILMIAFSSGLSASYSNLKRAADALARQRKEIQIIVIDSLCASLGEGLLIHRAVELKKHGKTMAEAADWIEAHKKNLVHAFTVDDCKHLYRGGRISKTAAAVGTVVNTKPMLHMNDSGNLVMVNKVCGRRKALNSLVDYMEKHMGKYRDDNDTVFISHGDALEDAEYVAQEVRRRFGICNVLINYVCPIIGAHSGPGTIALFFIGDKR